MTVPTQNLSYLPLNGYVTKVNPNSSSNPDQNKTADKLMFQLLLNQMISKEKDEMGSSSLLSSLIATNNLNLENSLNMMQQFNGSKGLSKPASLLNKYSNQKTSNLSGLGALSSKYESNGNPGTIANNRGDHGGKSYGAWQFSSKMGSLDSFINWLAPNHPDFYTKLSSSKQEDGGKAGLNFDKAWTSIAKADKDRFLQAQQDYVKHSFYDKAASSLKTRYGFDINNRSKALQECLFSTSVQHGVAGSLSVFSKLNLQEDDRSIINSLYNERQKVDKYFKSSSAQIKKSVYNRFSRERVDALNMLTNNLA